MTHTRTASIAMAAVLAACALCSCGGGDSSTSDSGGGGSSPPAATNVVSVVVDEGPVDTASSSSQPIGTVDTPFVTITLCVHGTSSCQTIDHISVDTGSSGLRIISSALSSSLASELTAVNGAQGHPLVECLPFADGYSWGSVKQADVRIGGEAASNISIQVIGDAAFPTVPDACSSGGGTQEDTVTAFGANGILGIAAFAQDCGAACVSRTSPQMYFDCPDPSSCTSTTVPLASQVWNPVGLFPVDNTGTILALNQVAAAGAISSSGSLIFGIDTASNNALGTATVLALDPDYGSLSATFNNQTLANSFIDSGSNGYFFDDSSIAACTSSNETGFYCPVSTLALTAKVTNTANVVSTISFNVTNADTLFHNGNGNYFVFNDLGGAGFGSVGVDFGLPFFLGRRVYTAIEHAATSGGVGPFVAY